MRLTSLAAGLVLALAAAPAAAQTAGTLTFTGTGDNVTMPTSRGTLAVGPYEGQINGPGTPVIDIYCVDYNHFATQNSTWNVNITRVAEGNLGNTRLGNDGVTGIPEIDMHVGTIDRYQAAAWLTMQYDGNVAQTHGIQSAIWWITSPSLNPLPNPLPPIVNVAGNLGDTEYWLFQAANRYRDYGDAYYRDNFVILTALDKASANSQQEFLARQVTTTPEPSTYLLLGSGLLGVFGMARVRQRQEA